MNKKLTVLSLFDGISCGQVALERAGIPIDTYYASEIDKYAIKVTQRNYPDTIQLGDVCDIDFTKYAGKIDLLIGGSPCQGFSIAGKQLNFNDERSKLFFEFLRALREVKPKYFLFENTKMKEEFASKINNLLGVNYVYLNSKPFTGLIRKRYYWFNWDFNYDIPSTDLKLKDVIDDLPYDIDLTELLSKTIYSPTTSRDGIITINPRQINGKQTWQRGRVYDIEGNCTTIQASMNDITITKDHRFARKLTINELERLQGLQIGYTAGISTNQRGKVLGNGWTVDTIAYILKGIKEETK